MALSGERRTSKKKAVDPVKDSPVPALDPVRLTADFAAAATAAGFSSTRYGEISGHALLAYTKRTVGPRPRIYLSSGVHGDEPAPPHALLSLMRHNFFDARCTWFVCPLINPTGFPRNTRENAQGIDLNRDYKTLATAEVRAHVRWLQSQPNFDLVLCVHEDWEANGFYLYELNPTNRPTLANIMLDAAAVHCPIETATTIDGRESVETGIIRPVSDPLLRDTWPEAIYLRQHHGVLHYTLESPSRFPLEQRVSALTAAITAAVATFLRQSGR